jgi:hypothetical protein
VKGEAVQEAGHLLPENDTPLTGDCTQYFPPEKAGALFAKAPECCHDYQDSVVF